MQSFIHVGSINLTGTPQGAGVTYAIGLTSCLFAGLYVGRTLSRCPGAKPWLAILLCLVSLGGAISSLAVHERLFKECLNEAVNLNGEEWQADFLTPLPLPILSGKSFDGYQRGGRYYDSTTCLETHERAFGSDSWLGAIATIAIHLGLLGTAVFSVMVLAGLVAKLPTGLQRAEPTAP